MKYIVLVKTNIVLIYFIPEERKVTHIKKDDGYGKDATVMYFYPPLQPVFE